MVNKLVIGTLTVGILGMTSCNYAVAELPCDYVKDVQTNWTQQIEKTSNIDKKVFPYVEDTRKCVMTMDVTIDGQTYPAEGSYVFGPDMTENNACDNATVNAKKSVISKVSPEILSAKTELNCSAKSEETVEVVQSAPVETVIVEKTIDNTNTTVVRSEPKIQIGLNLTDVVWGLLETPSNVPFIDPRQPRCKADWKTGGRWCHQYD